MWLAFPAPVVGKLEQNYEYQARDQAIAWACLGKRLCAIQMRAIQWQLHTAGEGGVDGALLSADVAALPLPRKDVLMKASAVQDEHTAVLHVTASKADVLLTAAGATDMPHVSSSRSLLGATGPGQSSRLGDPLPVTVHTATPEGQAMSGSLALEAVPGWPCDVPRTADTHKAVADLPGNIAATRWLNLMLLRAAPALYKNHYQALNAAELKAIRTCGARGCGGNVVGTQLSAVAGDPDNENVVDTLSRPVEPTIELKPEVALRWVDSLDVATALRNGRLLGAVCHALFPSDIPVALAGVASSSDDTEPARRARMQRVLPVLYKV